MRFPRSIREVLPAVLAEISVGDRYGVRLDTLNESPRFVRGLLSQAVEYGLLSPGLTAVRVNGHRPTLINLRG